jgi:hypothetical protein
LSFESLTMNAASIRSRPSSRNEHARQSKRPKIVSPSPSFCDQSNQATEGRISQVMSVIGAMCHQESTVYRPSNYLDREGTGVTEQDRRDMCEWGYNLADACNIDRSSATVAITYLDRFLSYNRSAAVDLCLANQREFQLAFIVSCSRCTPLHLGHTLFPHLWTTIDIS